MNLKWIRLKSIKHKTGAIYQYYYVIIKGEYKYCSRKLKDAEDFVIQYAQKNNIKNIYK